MSSVLLRRRPPRFRRDCTMSVADAACAAAAVYLGDIEMEEKFDALTEGKITALNQKEIKASMKGAAFSAKFSTPLL